MAQATIVHADKIEVQPRNASSTEMTDCATFLPEG